MGPKSATIKVDIDIAYPQYAVESEEDMPFVDAIFLKYIGIIVDTNSINAEFPTSYKIQLFSKFVNEPLFFFNLTPPELVYNNYINYRYLKQ